MRRAGFQVRAAVEVDAIAAETFRINHPTTKLLEEDIRKIKGKKLIVRARRKRINLLVGCAPCQGFCSLTGKKGSVDPRNLLILEMARIIRESSPDAVMMENVPGLVNRGREVFKEFLKILNDLGYYSNWRVVQMADYGIPQSRRRFVLLAGRGFMIPFPEPTHSSKPDRNSNLKPWISLREVIIGMPKPVTLLDSKKSGGPQKFNWHVVRNIQPQTKSRLRAAIPGNSRLNLDDSLRPNCHKNGYEGFSNVYGRMSWNQSSVTITGGCTTFCKGRFGHPSKRRTTISVREAALLQSFPKSYVFATNQMDAVCQLIGNAVPPKFASVIARQIRNSLRAHYGALARTR